MKLWEFVWLCVVAASILAFAFSVHCVKWPVYWPLRVKGLNKPVHSCIVSFMPHRPCVHREISIVHGRRNTKFAVENKLDSSSMQLFCRACRRNEPCSFADCFTARTIGAFAA